MKYAHILFSLFATTLGYMIWDYFNVGILAYL